MDVYAAPECEVRLEVQAAASLRLRPGCGIGYRSTHNAVRALLERSGGAREVRVHFGRLVDYPWLSTLLARQAAASRVWDREEGRPRPRASEPQSPERYVAIALRSMPEFTVLFDRWRVAGVATEKVLVRRAAELSLPEGAPLSPDMLLPYDALVTVTLLRE
jgi:hypothetical protein